jgi:hypothetical protein
MSCRCCDIGSRALEELLRQREERGEVPIHEHEEQAQQREGLGDLLVKEIQSLTKWGEADLSCAEG